ncbi:chemotaxis protein CheC [Candidatus Woesearchaeota archaeon]|nr:chemotaxis protein CheC [Candidatus Woesearchaeota archaeon]
MSESIKLSDFELDALKETANIGTGNASVALSALLNTKVDLDIPETMELSVHEVNKHISKSNESLVGIYSKVKEGMAGNILILMPFSISFKLINRLRKNEDAKDRLNDEDIVLLKKVGSILYSAYLTSLAKLFEQKIVFNPPNIFSAIGGSATDFILVQIGEKEKVLLITIHFNVKEQNIDGEFILLLTLKSLAPLLENLRKKMGIT